MDKLDAKVAIVTGAARGLGRAYAKRLAGLGAKVAVADLDSFGGIAGFALPRALTCIMSRCGFGLLFD